MPEIPNSIENKTLQADLPDIFKTISIVIPALNEEAGISGTIQSIPCHELESAGYKVQIIVVDNGSEDKTSEIARQAGAEVVSEPRKGYGRAYKTGFKKAIGEIIATADADLTYPASEIPILVNLLEKENLDFITTNRFAGMDSNAMSRRNKFGNKVLNWTLKLLFWTNIKDSQSGMWIIRKDLLNKMKLRSNGMSLSEEIKLEACYFNRSKWTEVPIKYTIRVGPIKLRAWRDGFINLSFLFRKRIAR